MRIVPIVFFVLPSLVAGCGKRDVEPLQSHGKPVAHWLDELKSPDEKVRKKAVIALGHAVPADRTALAPVIAALRDGDATVRDAAVVALLNLGRAARDAVPALNDALADKDATVRTHAARALDIIQK